MAEEAKNKASASKFRTSIGGQALIEGVLMRGPGKQAIVVRSPDGLVEKVEELTLVRDKYPVLGLPIIRGAVTFVDSMVKGVKALMFSADYFPDEDVAEPSKFDQWLEKKLGNEKMQKFITALAVFLSLGLTILLFFLLPTFLAGFIDPYIKSAAVHNLVESVIKLVIFFAYMILCSKQKDIYRVFQYHGAEHKTIFCYEAGLPLTVENCRIQPRHHRRARQQGDALSGASGPVAAKLYDQRAGRQHARGRHPRARAGHSRRKRQGCVVSMATTYNNLYLDLRTELRRAGDEEATQSARELVCAAAANLPNARVLLGEYDEEALKICRQNIRRNRLTARVASLKIDAREKPARTLGEFQFLVSNPPYIPSADIDTLDASVREHEPRLALDGGADGLDFYRVICEKWRDALCENGMLFFEVGIGQADQVLRIMRSHGFGDIQIVKDLNNIPRVVYGTRVETI